MCLGVPGKIIEIIDSSPLARRGKVSFSGIIKEINLSCVPEAICGDYVVVHVGVAISKIDEAEALRTLQTLEELGELDEVKR